VHRAVISRLELRMGGQPEAMGKALDRVWGEEQGDFAEESAVITGAGTWHIRQMLGTTRCRKISNWRIYPWA
jgi:hypothetical protein